MSSVTNPIKRTDCECSGRQETLIWCYLPQLLPCNSCPLPGVLASCPTFCQVSTSNFLSTHTPAQHTSAHASSVQIRNWAENRSDTWIQGVGLVIFDPEDSKHLGIEARKTLCCSCQWEPEFEMAANYTSDGDTCKECLLWFFFLRNGDLVVRKLLFLLNHASHLFPAVCMLFLHLYTCVPFTSCP